MSDQSKVIVISTQSSYSILSIEKIRKRSFLSLKLSLVWPKGNMGVNIFFLYISSIICLDLGYHLEDKITMIDQPHQWYAHLSHRKLGLILEEGEATVNAITRWPLRHQNQVSHQTTKRLLLLVISLDFLIPPCHSWPSTYPSSFLIPSCLLNKQALNSLIHPNTKGLTFKVKSLYLSLGKLQAEKTRM